MKAIGFTGNKNLADKNCFVEFDLEKPSPRGYDVLIKVEAVSINPVDTKIRKATQGVQNPPKILGRDASGIVEKTGEKVRLFKPGDKVFYSGNLKRSGSNTSYQLADERLIGHHPKNLSFTQAAAMPLTALTAWESIFDRLRIDSQKDRAKNILIIGGAGGVGSIAIQIAKKVAHLHIVATASRPESISWCKKMGADETVNHYRLVEEYENKKLKNPDYILCCSDSDTYYDAMVKLIAAQGLICLLVDSQKNYNLLPLKIKSAGIVWELMATRPIFETDDLLMQHTYLNEISKLLDQGDLVSTMTQNLGKMTVQNITKAHQLIEEDAAIGKIVMEGI